MFDVDADDLLVGRQVMKLMNALYQSSDHWFIYSNYIWTKETGMIEGLSKPIPSNILETNSYRTWDRWVTSALRTYKRELFMKIPKKYLLESENNFYITTYDRFLMYPLV